jgi:hypothetical protein
MNICIPGGVDRPHELFKARKLGGKLFWVFHIDLRSFPTETMQIVSLSTPIPDTGAFVQVFSPRDASELYRIVSPSEGVEITNFESGDSLNRIKVPLDLHGAIMVLRRPRRPDLGIRVDPNACRDKSRLRIGVFKI